MRLPRPDVILVQTPAASTLPVACLVARLRGARVVVDWQNLPHTLVAVSLGDTHRAVRAVRRRERRWGRRADGHLAASRALADWLQREYRIRADVVYDRPVRAQAEGSRDDVRGRLCRTLGIEAARLPLVLVSTSAGHNDFDMLIEALERAERHLASGDAARTGAAPADRSNEPALTNGPRAMVWIAGHGAGMDAFARRLQRRSFTALAVRTVSIDSGDAAAAAAAADLGLCVHQSSSGLDLPISLADFRGAGVPVCAFDYAPVLGEVLNEGREGLAFRDAGRLAALLVDAARGSSEAGGPIERSRAWLAANPPDWWEDHWERQARPTLDGK